ALERRLAFDRAARARRADSARSTRVGRVSTAVALFSHRRSKLQPAARMRRLELEGYTRPDARRGRRTGGGPRSHGYVDRSADETMGAGLAARRAGERPGTRPTRGRSPHAATPTATAIR